MTPAQSYSRAVAQINRRTAEEQAAWAAEHAERTRQRKEMYLTRLDRENAVAEAQANSVSSLGKIGHAPL